MVEDKGKGKGKIKGQNTQEKMKRQKYKLSEKIKVTSRRKDQWQNFRAKTEELYSSQKLKPKHLERYLLSLFQHYKIQYAIGRRQATKKKRKF